jgi:phenylacetate-coenzyme A ligase PaaK-like adenylate-forming protein
VEHLPECDPSRLPEVQDQLGRAMKTKGLRATVEIMPPNSFERTEFKAKRVIDRRR